MFITRPGKATMSVPLWRYWVEIAEENAALSMALQAPDEQIDAMSLSLSLAGTDIEAPQVPEFPGVDDVKSMRCALVSVAAAAHAIDGLYGSTKPLIRPPKSGAARHRQILETLKLGFVVGKLATQWADDLEWLFDTRDAIVHHAEDQRLMVVSRVTSQTVVVGGLESYQINAANASQSGPNSQKCHRALSHPSQGIH